MSDEPQQPEQIILDGSHGLGCIAKVIVLTRTRTEGEYHEDAYEIPYILLNQDMLIQTSKLNFIAGYSVVKQSPNTMAKFGL